MFRKFLEGLCFGSGFTIAFMVLWSVLAFTLAPALATMFMSRMSGEHEVSVSPPNIPGLSGTMRSEGPSFGDLSIEEQIEKSSVIAVARYEKAPDGKMKAIIREFLKKDPDATVYYKVGDEYPGASRYPSGNTHYGDGAVIFFVGSPASMRMSITYSGDRITGLGDMPIELLRQKCQAPNT